MKCALRLAAGRDCNLRTMPSVSKQHICAKRGLQISGSGKQLKKKNAGEGKGQVFPWEDRGTGPTVRRSAAGGARPPPMSPAPRPPRLHPTGESTARPLRQGKLQPRAHGGRPVPRPGRGAVMKGGARRGAGPRGCGRAGRGQARGGAGRGRGRGGCGRVGRGRGGGRGLSPRTGREGQWSREDRREGRGYLRGEDQEGGTCSRGAGPRVGAWLLGAGPRDGRVPASRARWAAVPLLETGAWGRRGSPGVSSHKEGCGQLENWGQRAVCAALRPPAADPCPSPGPASRSPAPLSPPVEASGCAAEGKGRGRRDPHPAILAPPDLRAPLSSCFIGPNISRVGTLAPAPRAPGTDSGEAAPGKPGTQAETH